ncbi:solute carrier family 12 member 9-like [Daphnia carinata]|uniref:solute carrier family 12 member 9-like n=1 Tax=Daphnia carinata TaxID=120202 RepID=UPI002580050E|nr:solute carrier family 12 member 9-like [Daphnia carinata]
MDDAMDVMGTVTHDESFNSVEQTPLLSHRRLIRSLSSVQPPNHTVLHIPRRHVSEQNWTHLSEFIHYDEPAQTPNEENEEQKSHRTLGSIAGVFSPVSLSMFSALLFLRVGFLIGHAGLLETLLQFLIAYTILVFTVTSVCAISTNGAIEGGGCYFMISRTLGPEFGGSIGTLFCLANIVSSALYLTGCAEGLVENFGPSGYLVDGAFPDGRWWRFLYASTINLVNIVVCLIGAAAFAKASAVILGIVIVCLSVVVVSFLAQPAFEVPIPEANHLVQNETMKVNGSFTGLTTSATFYGNLWPNYGQDYTSPDGALVSFATVFGVLFSGVTGIMAGANMSGELKDPSKSIPRGTLSAVGFTGLVYVILSLLTASTCSNFLLKNDYLFMMGICVWKPFVTVGIVTATWSASLSNLIGSSRVLAALARDDIFGSMLKPVLRGTYKGNPWCSVLFVAVLVEFCLLIGSLNVIAQLNSVLFLLSYCATNLACLMPELSSAPNFRPTFQYFTWHTALLGLTGTMVMMFVINPVYASVSLLLCLILIIMLHFFSPARTANWGSISQAIIFHQVRKYLLLLDSRKDHVKFWRPQILLLVSNPRSSIPLISFVNALKKSGLYVLGHVKIGSVTDPDSITTTAEHTAWVDLIERLKIKGFVETTVSPSVREGMHHLIRLSGLGAMKPNTICLGFYDSHPQTDLLYSLRRESVSSLGADANLYPVRDSNQQRFVSPSEYVAMVKDIIRLRKNVCLCRHFHTLDFHLITNQKKSMYMDVWPMNLFGGQYSDQFDTSSLFQLQLACILHMVPVWKDLELRVFLLPTPENEEETLRRQQLLRRQLKDLRIKARVVVATSTLSDGQQPSNSLQVNRLLLQNSTNSVVVFLYLPLPSPTQNNEEYLSALSTVSDSLPPVLFVHGISPVTSTNL